ncbi:MAG: hypothetical protein OEV30_11900, partial [Ignavibacteria bacterium]|nr:hypothetical protein [Ignavibacteria bacterium]
PGLYQYKFVIDEETYLLDPGNPASAENYDASSRNSVIAVTAEGEVRLTDRFAPATNPMDQYAPGADRKPVYLNIIWHQHQPLYVDPDRDQLQGPWVRTHATKDYYDMAAMLREYPDIHCTINLTSSLLVQLQDYYVERLRPFVETGRNRFDAEQFLARWKGRTDPWIDLALKPAEMFSSVDKDHLYRNIWNAFGISEVMIARFPQYEELKRKLDVDQMPGFDVLNIDEMREAKFWFFLAHFDPDFLRGPVTLDDGSVCDLSDLVREEEGETFFLRRTVTEEDCVRLVLEAYKVMSNIVPLHRSLLFDPATGQGQIDVITTPYYHPILPLIHDSDLARISQPSGTFPSRFTYPRDAEVQVARSVKLYKRLFGIPPRGMWPAEGAVAQPILEIFRRNNILWAASDVRVLKKSDPGEAINTTPYRFPAGSSDKAGSVAMVFRDTELSDRIGFLYQTYMPEAAAEDFVQSIISRQQKSANDQDQLLTVILDGENAWEWYREDMDGKKFLHALYRKLSKLQDLGVVRTVTMSEYLTGNPERSVPAHPMEDLPSMNWLWPGSWINGNYDTWIGEPEENEAWEYLRVVREDLERYGPPQPDPEANEPQNKTMEWYGWMAWESMYAAEGSDWFWWYGRDQSAPAGDEPFDTAFRVHLENVYRFLKESGREVPLRTFSPLLRDHPGSNTQGQGVMAQTKETVVVTFTCDMGTQLVDKQLFIVVNLVELGAWTPGLIPMFDDGTHGDSEAGDHVWSLQVELPAGEEIQYKYTNGGRRGEWGSGDEAPGRNRRVVLPVSGDIPVVLRDRFGVLSHE